MEFDGSTRRAGHAPQPQDYCVQAIGPFPFLGEEISAELRHPERGMEGAVNRKVFVDPLVRVKAGHVVRSDGLEAGADRRVLREVHAIAVDFVGTEQDEDRVLRMDPHRFKEDQRAVSVRDEIGQRDSTGHIVGGLPGAVDDRVHPLHQVDGKAEIGAPHPDALCFQRIEARRDRPVRPEPLPA